MFVPTIKNQVHIFATLLGVTLFSSMPVGIFTRDFSTFEVAYAAPVTSGTLIELTNQARVEEGLEALVVSPLLTQSAQAKSNDMLEKNYFAHTSPEGLSPWYWFGQVGYDYIYAGENLAKNYATAEAMFEAWMNSPTHRANILSANYQEIGIAVASDSEVLYATQHFGTPKESAAGTATVTPTPPAAPRRVAQAVADAIPPTIADVPLVDAEVEQGEEISIALSVSGDPEKVTVRAGEKVFSLTPDGDRWIGTMQLFAGGTYTVTAEAVDAAGNTMTVSLGSVTVLVPDVIRDNLDAKTMFAAYWKDVAGQEGWPIALALVVILATLIGVYGKGYLMNRLHSRFAPS